MLLSGQSDQKAIVLACRKGSSDNLAHDHDRRIFGVFDLLLGKTKTGPAGVVDCPPFPQAAA